ncbi:MAG: flagellar FlbD family protein [Planctomycetota bacterium]
MIKVTRLNGQEFILNAHLIKFMERTPDTLITLRDGEKILVREPLDVIIERAVEYRRSLRLIPGMD